MGTPVRVAGAVPVAVAIAIALTPLCRPLTA